MSHHVYKLNAYNQTITIAFYAYLIYLVSSAKKVSLST